MDTVTHEFYPIPDAQADLSLVPLEKLLEEIAGRVDTVVLLIHRRDNDQDFMEYFRRGSHYAAVGMVDRYQKTLEKIQKRV